MAHGGRARGEMGGHQRAVWEQQKVHCFPLLGSLENLTTGLIWLVTRAGGRGRRGEVAHGGRARGGDGRGAPESRATKCIGSLFDLAGDEGGGMGGEAWGGGPWRAGKGGDGGGHQRAVWEQQKVHWFPLLGSLKNLTTGLIWLVTRVGGWGEAWGGGPWRAGKGGRRGGRHERAVWEQQKCTASLKNPTTGLIWLVTRVGGWGAWAGGPWRAGKGGDGALVPPS